jgi:hypothetical protein
MAEPLLAPGEPFDFMRLTSDPGALPLTSNGEPLDTSLAELGYVRQVARLTSWDAVRSGASVTLTANDKLTDLSGNQLLPFAATLRFLDLGPSYSQITFTNPGSVASWGNVSWWPFDDPNKPCSIGACEQIGPVELAYCDVPRAGIAGLVDVYQNAMSYFVSYELRAASDISGQTGFVAQTALPGGAPIFTLVPLPALSNDGASSELPYTTSETFVELPLPVGLAPPAQFGYAIAIGNGSTPCLGGPAPNFVNAELIVRHVASTRP